MRQNFSKDSLIFLKGFLLNAFIKTDKDKKRSKRPFDRSSAPFYLGRFSLYPLAAPPMLNPFDIWF